jgi:hypothetical protein
MKLSKLLLISLIILPFGSTVAFAKGDVNKPSEAINKMVPHADLHERMTTQEVKELVSRANCQTNSDHKLHL